MVTTSQIPGGVPLNVWNTLSVTVAGPSITVALNGVTTIQYTDPTPYLTGTIALSGCCSTDAGPIEFDNILVTVPAAPMPVCTYTNSLAALSIPGSGGAGIVHVSTNDPRCSWTAAAGQNWTTITSGSYSLGNVPVLFTAAPNPSNNPRTGTITIAGQPFTITQAAGPILGIRKIHSGNFVLGQAGETYWLTVSNASAASATSGAVTVTEAAPMGLTLVSMAGTGWTCPSGGTTCTRSDVLNGGASYAPIVVTVNVASDAAAEVINQASVSMGGFTLAAASDTTSITAFTCDVGGEGKIAVVDIQLLIEEVSGMLPAAHDLNHDGVVNVADVQKLINAALGKGCPN